MKKYIICDNTADSRIYIDWNNENTSILENAMFFKTEEEAQKYIESHEWDSWAYVLELE